MSNEFNLVDGTPPVIDLMNIYKGNINIRRELDDLVRDAGYGSISSINYLVLRGFNYLRHGQQLVSNNRDNMGYVFFTRPILNLTYDNLSASDFMSTMRNAHPISIQKFVRMTLDPWSHRGINMAGNKNGNAVEDLSKVADASNRDCPLVDPFNPFIPILSNTLVSLTGWKDITLNDYTSPKGINNEQWGMVDGHYYITDSYELSSSFRNVRGDPITLLFQTWCHYMIACRHLNEMNPYPVFVADREWDYNTRIYRFVMDSTRTYIQKYAATIAFPMTDSIGNSFNWSSDKNFIEATNEISVTWKCFGADYNRPILFYEFNKLVETYCPDLRVLYNDYDHETNSLKIAGGDRWVKLKPKEKNRGLFRAIPLINFITSELEWWIRKEDYNYFVLRAIGGKPNEVKYDQKITRPTLATPPNYSGYDQNDYDPRSKGYEINYNQ